jgi:hypothetical protein
MALRKRETGPGLTLVADAGRRSMTEIRADLAALDSPAWPPSSREVRLRLLLELAEVEADAAAPLVAQCRSELDEARLDEAAAAAQAAEAEQRHRAAHGASLAASARLSRALTPERTRQRLANQLARLPAAHPQGTWRVREPWEGA